MVAPLSHDSAWSVAAAAAKYTTGEEWRNNFRKNEETEPKQKQREVKSDAVKNNIA